MSRRLLFLALASTFLLIAGCGGSSHSTNSNATAPSTTSPSKSSSATASGSSTSSTATKSSTGGAAPAGTGTGTGASGGAPVSGSGKKSGQANTGSTNVRVPATFTIGPGSQLSPSQISAPPLLAIQVTIIDRDGHAHRVVLQTPTPHPLDVSAGGRARVLLAGMKAGRFTLQVDGKAAGVLVVGGEPGP